LIEKFPFIQSPKRLPNLFMKKFLTIIPIALIALIILPITVTASDSLAEDLSGRILLQVENHGEAWYVNPADGMRYYLANGPTALALMQELGTGISNVDLRKIPPQPPMRNARFDDQDADNLEANYERAIGTSPDDQDTDNDGYWDDLEIINGYDPLGSGAWPVDSALVRRLRGHILLQVQHHGEAWYLDPISGWRFYMENGNDAMEIMREMGLGISNADLVRIPIGTIETPLITDESPLPETENISDEKNSEEIEINSEYEIFKNCESFEIINKGNLETVVCHINQDDPNTIVLRFSRNHLTKQADTEILISLNDANDVSVDPVFAIAPIIINTVCEATIDFFFDPSVLVSEVSIPLEKFLGKSFTETEKQALLNKIQIDSTDAFFDGYTKSRATLRFSDTEDGDMIAECSARQAGFENINFVSHRDYAAEYEIIGQYDIGNPKGRIRNIFENIADGFEQTEMLFNRLNTTYTSTPITGQSFNLIKTAFTK